MTMPGRKSHVSKLWLASSLALLALVLSAPVRSLKATTDTSQADCLSHDLAVLPGQPTTPLGLTTAADALPHVPVVLSDSGKKAEADAVEEAPVRLASPFTSCKVFTRQLISPRPILSRYPLRC